MVEEDQKQEIGGYYLNGEYCLGTGLTLNEYSDAIGIGGIER